MEIKYEHAKFVIERFDHYYDTVNSKGSFYIGLNTFILGGLCAGYISIADKMVLGLWFWVLAGLTFAICIASIFFTISAISPFVKDNQNNDDKVSFIFFGGIAKHTLNSFLEQTNNLTLETINEDMQRQTHCLANGLKKKFRKLAFVGYLLVAQFVTLIFLCIYVIKNYTP
jgi:hypothetical protein